MDIYKERILPLFQSSGIPDAELERKIGIKPKKINDWNAGRTKSYEKYIPQIASYFHVSADYLLGKTDDPRPVGQKEAPTPEGERKPDIEDVKIALFGGDGEVTDEMWEEALFAAEMIKERYKRKKAQND